MTSKDDEYIDYSCSTPVERLSRDIETILRSWHVVAGADRHFSIRRPESSSEYYNLQNNVHLLRSARVGYTTTLTTNQGQERMTVELDLNLWDGPIQEPTSSHDQRLDNLHSHSPHIPFSLISYRNFNSSQQRDLLSSLSSLLGIGQHITLSPTPSLTNTQFFQTTFQSIARVKNPRRTRRRRRQQTHAIHGKNRRGTSSHVSVSSLIQASDFFTRKKRVSLEDIVTLHTATIQSLSHILQTALNFATSSCDCRIPAFGIWGIYRPHEAFLEMDNMTAMNFVEDITSNDSNQEHLHSNRQENVFHTYSTRTQNHSNNLYEVPPWINPENLYHLAAVANNSSSFPFSFFDDMDTTDDDIGNDSDDSQSVSTIDTDSSNDSREHENGVTPSSPRHKSFPAIRQQDHHRVSNPKETQKQQHVHFSPIFNGYCYPGPSHNAVHASFAVHVIPAGVPYPIHASTLNSLGQMLLQQSYPPLTKRSRLNPYGKVVVAFARHQFTWNQILDSDSTRRNYTSTYYGIERLDIYTLGRVWRKALCPDFCHAHSSECTHEQIQLMEQVTRILYHAYYASRKSSRVEPLWGPKDDPLLSINVSVTWNQPVLSPSASIENRTMKNHLLVLPLRIRSHHSLTPHDMWEMENSILSSVFNPITAPPRSFVASAHFSKDCAYGTLSANIRCILAALIRTCSLEPDTLLGHLTKPQVLNAFHEQKSLQDRARNLMDRAKVSALTRNLVEALDWDDSDIDSSDWRLLAVNLLDNGRFQTKIPMNHKFDDDKLSLPFHRFAKTCCPGSLMSVISMCIGSLRKPSMMSALWLEIVEELRLRWARRETIKNVIPSDFKMSNLFIPPSSYSIKQQKAKSKSRTLKKDGAAFLFSSESEPDCNDCLLAQKFQVFNIGVEIMIARETDESRLKKLHELNDAPDSRKFSPEKVDNVYDGGASNNWCNQSETATSIAGNRTREGANQRAYDSSSSSVLGDAIRSRLKGSSPPSIDAVMEDEVNDYQDRSDSTSEQGAYSDSGTGMKFTTPSVHSNQTSSKYEFYDARTCIETGTIDKLSDRSSDIGSTCSYTDDANMDGPSIEEMSASVVHRLKRHGARCPVLGVNLIASGDQLYAPYLLRPPPITDDLTYQRRYLLQKNIDMHDKTMLKSSLEIIHRLQKPQLLSDASAFKAANPGAIFQDFVNWYGNPENPMAEFIGDDTVSLHSGVRDMEGDASMAALILTATRTFWSDVWDEAEPRPATDQRPLFDPIITVETLLSSLETLHPSFLLNQVLSVNISLACYLLETCAFFCKLKSIENVIDNLFLKVHDALVKLNNDMTSGTLSPIQRTDKDDENSYMISYDTITACEVVCDAIGEAEVLLSQASSLLSKFDGDCTTVEELVLNRVNCFENKDERITILNNIRAQQELLHVGAGEAGRHDIPNTSVREYTLRTIDHVHPCQMSVRIGGSLQSKGENSTTGGLVLSISKCNQ